MKKKNKFYRENNKSPNVAKSNGLHNSIRGEVAVVNRTILKKCYGKYHFFHQTIRPYYQYASAILPKAQLFLRVSSGKRETTMPWNSFPPTSRELNGFPCILLLSKLRKKC